jgi:hypothetical protein
MTKELVRLQDFFIRLMRTLQYIYSNRLSFFVKIPIPLSSCSLEVGHHSKDQECFSTPE